MSQNLRIKGWKINKNPWLYIVIVTPSISWWILEGESISACRWGRIPKSMLELLSLASVRTCIPSSFALSWGDVFCCFSPNTDTHHVLWETTKIHGWAKSRRYLLYSDWRRQRENRKQKHSRQSILANLGLWLASVYLSTTTPWCFSWSSQPLDLELKPEKKIDAQLCSPEILNGLFFNGTGTHWNFVDSFQLKLSYIWPYIPVSNGETWLDIQLFPS